MATKPKPSDHKTYIIIFATVAWVLALVALVYIVTTTVPAKPAAQPEVTTSTALADTIAPAQ